VTLLASKEPYRQTDTEPINGSKVPPFNPTVNVGNDK